MNLSSSVISDRLSASATFWLYAVMCAVDLVFMIFFLPETKGKTLEEIERRWLKTGPKRGS